MLEVHIIKNGDDGPPEVILLDDPRVHFVEIFNKMDLGKTASIPDKTQHQGVGVPAESSDMYTVSDVVESPPESEARTSSPLGRLK